LAAIKLRQDTPGTGGIRAHDYGNIQVFASDTRDEIGHRTGTTHDCLPAYIAKIQADFAEIGVALRKMM